jgi:hypothetical protein
MNFALATGKGEVRKLALVPPADKGRKIRKAAAPHSGSRGKRAVDDG